MNWYITVLKQYAVFEGRARRMEYWMFALFNIIIAIGLGIVDGVAGSATESGIGILGGIYNLAVLIPSIAVAVRRLHDTGRSGLWVLIAFVPCVDTIILQVFLIQESVAGDNQCGINPIAEGG